MTRSNFQKAFAAATVLVLGCVTFVVQGQSQDEAAQRRYDSGRAFYDAGKYTEALRDFQVVIDSYPTSPVADKALLDIATYQLDVVGDPSAASASVETLLKKYPNAASAPMALVMQGRITLAKGLSGANLDEALANFDRVPRLFPGSDAVPAALYNAGVAMRLAGRAEAFDRFSQVSMEYPSSIWAARARLGLGIGFTLNGNPTRAMQELQRVRTAFPGTGEATAAMAWNTILYRLYIRPPAQPPYALAKRSISGPAGKIKDVLALGVDGANRLFVVNKSAVQIFDEKGGPLAPLRDAVPTGIFFDTRGLPVTITETALSPAGRPSLTLAVPQPDGKVREIRGVTAGVTLPNGDYLVANRDQKVIERFAPAGTFVGRFASGEVDRLAIDFLGNVAALEGNAKTVTIFNRDGKQVGRIQPRGAGYELREPVDLAFDALGHLYVLDRNRGTVFVFSNDATRLVTSFSLPDKAPGAFFHAKALGLDSAGRLYIFDDQAERIQIYQ
jgi:TolA-binding protein